MTSMSLTHPTPSPFYYLDHFRFAMAWLHSHYGDLLSREETTFVEEFSRLPERSQALLVRLIMRKGPHFRTRKICYAEIGDIDSASAPLVERQWVDPEPRLTVVELGRLLTGADLKGRFQELPRHVSKAQALELLIERHPGSRGFGDWCPSEPERVYSIPVSALCTRLRLLFFGNFRQEWSEFVLADLGIFRYEEVRLSRHSRAFDSRRDIEDFFRLYECRQRLRAQEPLDRVLEALPRKTSGHEWLESRRGKLLFEIARRQETSGAYADALALYRESAHPEARLRSVRVLEIQGCRAEALEAACAALARPQSDAEEQRMFRSVRRLERCQGLPMRKTASAPLPERCDCVVAEPQAGKSVEHLVREHFHTPALPVYFVENSLINSLFGLLCWEAVFAPVRGAFFHAFQSGPMDLHSRWFRDRRRPLIERCLGCLESDSYRSLIEETAHSKHGIQSPFVSWGLLSDGLLKLALACIPAAHLRLYFERLLANLAENRSGLPDLIQFSVTERRYRLIEVKGPGDRLQDNQRRWMDYCLKHELPVTVCHARWTAAA